MKQTALITGASRGIGRETARLFAKEGYRVIINYNTGEEAAQRLLSELQSDGFDAQCILADVSDRMQVQRMFAQAGAVDILVNNAGIAQQKLFSDISEEEWDRMFAVHVRGTFHCCQCALPHMLTQKKGKIINISSMWGITGASCEVHYSAAKAAVIGFTKALAKELAPSNIHVNCVAPGVTDTDMLGELTPSDLRDLAEMTPLMRIGTAADIAAAILFLASDKADFITGQVLSPNGGFVI